MITPEYKIKIKEVLGCHYAPKIVLHLKKRRIKNANGELFSYESIHKIVGGSRTNRLIESEIVKLVKITEKQQAELQSKMNPTNG